MKKEITLREHLKKIARKRWEGKSKEERSAHGKRMVEARERRRALDCEDTEAANSHVAEPSKSE